jgi:hypothetical protein
MKTYLLAGAVALFILALISMPASAEDRIFTAFGTVIDELGRPVPGANVTLVDEHFCNISTTVSDSNGNYRFNHIAMPSSPYLRVMAEYHYDGTVYSSRLENCRWYDVSSGLVEFDRNDTRLSHFPVSDHGFAWGVVLDSASGGRPLDAAVYLVNNTTALTTVTSSSGAYEIMATTGDYEIYALTKSGDSWLMSDPVRIAIQPAYIRMEANPLTLVASVETASPPPTPTPIVPPADQTSPRPTEILLPPPTVTPAASQSQPAKVLPLAAALALGILLIIAGWALMGRRQ